MSSIKEIFKKGVELDASDIHLKPGKCPFYRVHGKLVKSGFMEFDAEKLTKLLPEILPQQYKNKEELPDEIDFSYSEPGVGRFRINIFISQGVPTYTFRYVKTEIPTLSALHLPPIIEKIALSPSGIILACGPTNAGKSTTLATCIQTINTQKQSRIITVEDPVEYLFEDQQSLITQREVGVDTVSMTTALKYILRQDPDVIMIGEVRDPVCVSLAVSAAETGHVVLSTLHAETASQAVEHILHFYPSSDRSQILLSLANNLKAIISQRLVPASEGGLRPAVEILLNTPSVRSLLLKGKLELLSSAIETDQQAGMQTFNQSLYQLVKNGAVTESSALSKSPKPEALQMNLEGVFLDEDKRILGE